MKMTIGYLYYDLLNLYGDSGNIKTLLYHLEEQGIKVTLKYLSVGDKKDFSKLDMIYIGSGTEENLLIALDDLKNDLDSLKKFVEDKKFILSTGNSLELFGNYIITNKKIKCLGLYDYVVMYNEERIVKDVRIKTDLIENEIIGFENHLGKVLSFNEDIISIDNFIGTYIIGPILSRNPYFCSYYIKRLITSKKEDFEFKEENYELDIKAYNKTVENK